MPPDALKISDLLNLVVTLGPKTHPGTAMLLTARLEHILEHIVQLNMPRLSNRMKPRMFEGYGPLATFSAKIDVAFALAFIDETDAQLLHAIRAIRNEFAHADEELSFHSPEIVKLIRKLPGSHKRDPFIAFTEAVEACNSALGEQQEKYYALFIEKAGQGAAETAPDKPA